MQKKFNRILINKTVKSHLPLPPPPPQKKKKKKKKHTKKHKKNMIWGFESLQVETFSVLKILDTFTRTPVRVSKMNAVARAQLTIRPRTVNISNVNFI